MKHHALLKLLPVGLLIFGLASSAFAQGDYHDRARSIVARTDNDLRMISTLPNVSPKERELYDKALHHFSDFDKEMARGKYDKGKLDEAIEHLDKIVKENTLSPDDRDRLMSDLRDLRELRSAWR